MVSIPRLAPSSAARAFRALRPLVAEQRWLYAAAGLFVTIGAVVTLSYPIYVKRLIDEGVLGGQRDRLHETALVLLVLLLTETVATVVRDYYFTVAAERVTAGLRRQAFDHLLAQDIAFFDAGHTGALTTRLWIDVAAIQRFVGEPLGDGVRSALFGVVGAGLLCYTSPPLAVLVLLAVPPILVVARLLGRRVNALAGRAQEAYAASGATAEEALGGIRTVRAFSREATERARYGARIEAAVEAARRRILTSSSQTGVSFLIGECAALLGLWAGGGLILEGRLTPGALISFVLYGFLMARGLRNAADFWSEAMRAVGATRWIFDLLEREPRMPLHGGARIARVEGALAWERVRFRYPTRPDVDAVAGLDLHVRPGETVALVGRSGAGKSTLVSLLLRFYDPDEGRVLLDGRDLRELDPTWLRGRIGVVLQEPVLFSGTIAENIRYGADGADDGQVALAAERAGVRAFIESLPDGFRTPVGTRGVQLSGGQRQRLAIARALLRQPAILVFDEATNALDAVSESDVVRAVRALDRVPTTLIVAHRLSTVLGVDRTVVLDHGVVVADGRHDDLVQSSPVYRDLIHTQLAIV